MNNKNFDKVIQQIDLYKEYGEFNFLFEDTIQSYRLLLISLVRQSYEYFEEEDVDNNELEYHQQDRLLKIILHNIGAMDIVENCRACFTDLLSSRKLSSGKYYVKNFDEEIELSESFYMNSISLFKKTIQLVEFRNLLIHSYFTETLNVPGYGNTELVGLKNIKTSRGYEHRQFNLTRSFLENVNRMIRELYMAVNEISLSFVLGENKNADTRLDSKYINSLEFKI